MKDHDEQNPKEKDHNDFRCGPLRKIEWTGFWKAHPDEDIMTFDEWDAAWESLRNWLRKRWVVDWVVSRGRQIYVLDSYFEPERTLYIEVWDTSILTPSFVEYVRDWLKSGYTSWRVEILTDSNEDGIMIYPEGIRINEVAERDLDTFLAKMRPRIQQANEQGARELGTEWRGWIPEDDPGAR